MTVSAVEVHRAAIKLPRREALADALNMAGQVVAELELATALTGG